MVYGLCASLSEYINTCQYGCVVETTTAEDYRGFLLDLQDTALTTQHARTAPYVVQ